MKRILCFILAVLMLTSLVSCCDDAEESSDAPKESSTEVSKAPVRPEPRINGIKLSDFNVVFKNNSNDTVKFRTAAQFFVKQVKEQFGVTLKCVSDASEEVANEIIFGVTKKRDICKDKTKKYGIGGYELEVRGTKVLFAATYANGAQGACVEFLEKLSKSENVVDMKTEGEKKVIKVACVGDSITYGATSTSSGNNYPAFLQDMLGLDYHVFNAGISGYSIVKSDQYAYAKAPQFHQAKNFVPDVVIFALGTNDANPTPSQPYKNWEDAANDRKNKFTESTNELLDAFAEVNPDVQIYMVLPSSLFKVGKDEWNAEAWNANLTKYVIPNLTDIAEKRKLKIIDLYEWSLNNEEVFVDGLHPKDDGYRILAQHIYGKIRENIKKPIA